MNLLMTLLTLILLVFIFLSTEGVAMQIPSWQHEWKCDWGTRKEHIIAIQAAPYYVDQLYACLILCYEVIRTQVN